MQQQDFVKKGRIKREGVELHALVECYRKREGREKGRVQIEKMSKEIVSRLKESGRVERERWSSFRQ